MKARKNKTKSPFLKIIFTAILIFSVIVWVLSVPFWHIKKIIIEGNNIISNHVILKTAQIPQDENIFFLNYNGIRKRLKTIPQIKNVFVSGKLPNSISIRIEERKPISIFIIDGKYYAVDDEGVIIRSVENDNLSLLPAVVGLNSKVILDNQKIDAKNMYAVKKSFSILTKIFDKSRFVLEMRNADDISIIIDDIIKVKLGNYEDIDRKLSVVSTLLNSAASERNKIEYIDVRVVDNPAIKFK